MTRWFVRIKCSAIRKGRVDRSTGSQPVSANAIYRSSRMGQSRFVRFQNENAGKPTASYLHG